MHHVHKQHYSALTLSSANKELHKVKMYCCIIHTKHTSLHCIGYKHKPQTDHCNFSPKALGRKFQSIPSWPWRFCHRYPLPYNPCGGHCWGRRISTVWSFLTGIWSLVFRIMLHRKGLFSTGIGRHALTFANVWAKIFISSQREIKVATSDGTWLYMYNPPRVHVVQEWWRDLLWSHR